jgi:peptide/nickel transport system permease protein
MSTTLTDAPVTAAEPASPAPPAKRRNAKQFLLYIAVAWLVVVLFHAIFASLLPYVTDNPTQTNNAKIARIGPGSEAWFGGDQNGRDIFSYCVYGARASLLIGIATAVLGMVVGGTLGLLAGYFRGWIDSVITSVADVMLSFPSLILLIAITSFWGRETYKIIIGLTILSVAPLARLVRANTIVYAQREFVTAAKALGAPNRRIILREVMPNVVPVALSFSFLAVAIIIVAEGTLAFLGVGLDTTIASWGTMIVQGRSEITRGIYHIVIMPSLVLVLTVLSLNVIGEKLRSKFDVRESAV